MLLKEYFFKNTLIFVADVTVTSHDTPYSHRKELHWDNVENTQRGEYVCRANVIKDDKFEEKSWILDISAPKKPEIEETTIIGHTLKHSLGEPLELKCKFIGLPRPTVVWFKDDVEITNDENDTRITLRDNNTVIDIRYIKMEDQGKYKCQGSNRLGTDTRETLLKITSNIGYLLTYAFDPF